MKALLAALACGAFFGAGLVVSDMINPARVLAFLDVTGAWDPSLALVMIGALLPSAFAYVYSRRLRKPIVAENFLVPRPAPIDRRLLSGAALFGIGWGIVGLCPGPALAAITTARWPVALFVLSMLAGMTLHRFVVARA